MRKGYTAVIKELHTGKHISTKQYETLPELFDVITIALKQKKSVAVWSWEMED